MAANSTHGALAGKDIAVVVVVLGRVVLVELLNQRLAVRDADEHMKPDLRPSCGLRFDWLGQATAICT